MTKKISIVCPTYNEEENVDELIQRIQSVMSNHPYDYELIFIDNASTDGTVSKLKTWASNDDRIKLICNARNFGHIRSPFYGLLQASGDAVILIASDLQDPPEEIHNLLNLWLQGEKLILMVKSSSQESFAIRQIRRSYYKLVSRLSETPLVNNATGSGLFDRAVVSELKKLQEPYPYFRGLVVDIGFKVATLSFHQPARINGKTKNNLVTLYDMAILGLTTYGKSSIRLISLAGFTLSVFSLLVAIGYGVAKLVFWESFETGLAPLLIGVFFFGSVQIFLLGLIGEYLVDIQRRAKNMPLVIEDYRINF